MSNFRPLKFVCRGGETQIQMSNKYSPEGFKAQPPIIF